MVTIIASFEHLFFASFTNFLFSLSFQNKLASFTILVARLWPFQLAIWTSCSLKILRGLLVTVYSRVGRVFILRFNYCLLFLWFDSRLFFFTAIPQVRITWKIAFTIWTEELFSKFISAFSTHASSTFFKSRFCITLETDITQKARL